MKKTRLLFTFIMCTLLALTLFSVSAAAEGEEKTYFKAAFGNIFEYTVENGEATIVGATIEKGDVIIPNELGGYPVKKIGKKAFYDEYKIKSIFIQSGIEEIGEKAFSSLGDWEADACVSLTLPDTLKKVGYEAFSYFDLNGELILPESLEYIDTFAFQHTSVYNKELFIPKNVEHIGTGAFLDNGFIKYKVDENNKYFSNDDVGALYNKDKTVLIHYPNGTYEAENTTFTIPDTVVTVATYCFYNTRCLEEIVIPESVRVIEDHAFDFAATLKRIVYPKTLEKVGRAFLYSDITHEVYYEGSEEQWNEICEYFSSNVEKIHFLYGTEIHEYSEEITKAPTCKLMGQKTYTCTCGVTYTEYTDGIKEDHSKYYSERVVTPAQLKKDGKKEIICEICGVVDSGNIPEIRSIYVQKEHSYTGKEIKPEVDISTRADISKNEYEIIYPEKAVDVGTYKLTVVFKNRFEGTHEYTFKIVPSSVQNLASKLSAKGITFTWDKVKEATGYKIGVSVDNGEYKYYDVSADTTTWLVPSVYDGGELEIDKYCVFTITAVTKLSDGTSLEGYTKRVDVKFTPEQKTYKAAEGTYTYFLLGDEATIIKADIKGDVTLPSKLGGKKVTGILSYAFRDLSKLTGVVIPEGVRSIGVAAFKDSGITKLTLPATLTDIDENAFQYCKKLKTIVLSEKNTALTLDESGGLYNKEKTELILFPAKRSVKEYTLPETVTKIWSYAFAYNSTLKSVTVNEGVTQIGEFAFHCCKGMTALSLPQSLETVGQSAFRACTKLTDVVIGEKVKRLPTYTFAYCTRLKNVTLPKGLETISSKVFFECHAIEEIVIPNVKSIGYDAFWNLESLKALYFMGTREEWQAATKKYDVGFFNDLKVHYSYEDFVHEFKITPTNSEPTCTNSGYGLYECPCGLSYYSSIPANGHSYTTVYPSKATTEKNGMAVSKCDVCSFSKTEKISKVNIAYDKSYVVYTGQTALPKVTLKSGDTVLEEGTDYFITFLSPDSTDYGEYKISIKSAENRAYEFDAEVSYSILPGETEKLTVSQTTSSIKLSWSKVYGATGYRVYLYDYNEKEWVRIKSTTANSFTLKALNSGTRYRFAVQAYHKTADGTVYFSGGKVAVTTSTKPATVKSLKASSPAKGKLSLSWANISGETSFEIYYSTSKNGTYKKYCEVGANTVKYNAANLKSGNTLYFKVRACKTINGVTVYGDFSTVKGVKIR